MAMYSFRWRVFIVSQAGQKIHITGKKCREELANVDKIMLMPCSNGE